MTLFIVLVLAIATLVFIVYPFFRRGSRSMDSGEDEKLRALYSKRDTAYSMLKELEFDFQSDILTERDYRDLESRYKSKAISILRDIDNLKKGAMVEGEIERQVLELRKGKGLVCPQCGTKCQEGNRFCSRCGTSLSQGESVD